MTADIRTPALGREEKSLVPRARFYGEASIWARPSLELMGELSRGPRLDVDPRPWPPDGHDHNRTPKGTQDLGYKARHPTTKRFMQGLMGRLSRGV